MSARHLDLELVQLQENLAKYYEPSELGVVARLQHGWRQLISSEGAVAALERGLSQFDCPAAGLAWWEERRGEISALDCFNFWLCTFPGGLPRVVPRGHHPIELVGTWQWMELPGRRWVLRADGRMEVAGADSDGVDGAGWRVHHAQPDELWISRVADVHPRKWSFWLEGAVLEVRPPGGTSKRHRLESLGNGP